MLPINLESSVANVRLIHTEISFCTIVGKEVIVNTPVFPVPHKSDVKTGNEAKNVRPHQ